MNGFQLLNELPIVAITPQRVLGFVSPLVRALSPSIEDQILNVVLTRFESGEETVTLPFQAPNEAISEIACKGLRTASGEIVFLVQKTARVVESSSSLGALGEIAAGVAHEINTPLQYITDNTHFVADGVAQILSTLKASQAPDGATASASISADETRYLTEELPRALTQSLDGLAQVAEIVQALKEFSHQSKEKSLAQINDIIRRALTLTKNEWKYNARVDLDLDPLLPEASVITGEVCQTLVNLIVNSSHAIADAQQQRPEPGMISISTRQIDQQISIKIRDNGTGISDQIRSKIFDPFFTTKKVGKGTGQGLRQVKNCIEALHGGSVSVENCADGGAVFSLNIPLAS